MKIMKFTFIYLLVFSFFQLHGQAPKKKRTGPSPNTENNTTLPQSGNNKKFPSNKNATTGNPSLKSNKGAMKKKQEQNAKFSGNEEVKKRNKLNTPPPNQNTKGKVSTPVDQSGYNENRNKSLKSLEQPNEKIHEHQGNVVIKKKSQLDGSRQAAEIDHTNRKSESVDHTKYQGYRKKAFDKRESDYGHLNSQGSSQYGIREEESVNLEKRQSIRKSKDRERMEYSGNSLPKAFKPTGSDFAGDVKVEDKRKSADVDQARFKYSGDINVEARDKKSKDGDHERAEYSGDRVVPNRDKKIKDSEQDRANYSGDRDISGRDKKIKDGEQERAEYTGDRDISGRDKKIKDGEQARADYTGDVELGDREKNIREGEKQRAQYSGDMDLEGRDKMRRMKQKEIAQNSGDIAMHDVMKKAKEIRKKEKVISKYSGDILVKTIRARDNKNRIKAKKIANWEGDIVVAKRRKGSHPSAAYSGGKVANSYKAREKYRKKMLKKYGRNPGIETPNYQKRKFTKPTYDKEEGKIWDVQKYKESKTKETQ